MDSMIFYHANAQNEELSAIADIISVDIENNISTKATEKDNSFSITVSEVEWAKSQILIGHRLYIPNTEWGGIVTSIQHSTQKGTVTLSGTTWRGILHGIVVEPEAGEAYVEFTGIDANEAIELALNNRYQSLIEVTSAVAGVNVTGQWRYKTVAKCLNDTLGDFGLCLKVIWSNVDNKIILSAEPVNTMSDDVELSQDYGIDFTSNEGCSYLFNRCIGLGKGELQNRTVVDVYYSNGEFYSDQPVGWVADDERTLIYDYPSAETAEELWKGAKDRLEGYIPRKSITINQITTGITVELGDILGTRDRLTGMVGQSKVIRKILKITDGKTRIDMGVE